MNGKLIVIVWQSWWTLALLLYAIVLDTVGTVMALRYKRKLRVLNAEIERLAGIQPGQVILTFGRSGDSADA